MWDRKKHSRNETFSGSSAQQFTFYHYVLRNFWYSFYRPRKDERFSQPWSHPVVLNRGPPESSDLTTGSTMLFFKFTMCYKRVYQKSRSRDPRLGTWDPCMEPGIWDPRLIGGNWDPGSYTLVSYMWDPIHGPNTWEQRKT